MDDNFLGKPSVKIQRAVDKALETLKTNLKNEKLCFICKKEIEHKERYWLNTSKHQ